MRIIFFVLCLASITLISCNTNTHSKNDTNEDSIHTSNTSANNSSIMSMDIAYATDDQSFKSFVAYPKDTESLPIVLVVPEWWGVNAYTKSRVEQLASLGYFALAVDMYGDGKTVETPDSAGALASPFYKDAQLAKRHFDAAIEKAKTFAQVDTSKIAAIGYCFGGGMVLNMARLGTSLKGVVSFHGSLNGNLPPAQKNSIKPALLVLHGEADSMVPQNDVDAFKKEMTDAAADYKFISYPGAKHAFSNPNATAVGQKYQLDIAYDEAADKASWAELVHFLNTVFK